MSNDQIIVPNNTILQDFRTHLNLNSNDRILLTAPFGSGKSTFIQEFEQKYEHNFRFIKLYPVNYAVASNEDIFELVKFDILFELVNKYADIINLEKEDFDKWLRLFMFFQNKTELMPLFLFILSQHEKIGKSAASFVGAFEAVLKPLKKSFKEYSTEIKIDEFEDIYKYIEEFKNKKGSPYEMDATSQFIYNLLERLKVDTSSTSEDTEFERNLEYKTVLVIDDLDRLDPDHIFRLFNIFSAHTHSITNENKFGFDKVIFICDLDNIEKIYFHKYGRGVDFAGYIDKFYSNTPFRFDKSKELSNYIEKFITDIKIKNCDSKFNELKMYKNSLIGLLKILNYYNDINLRTLHNLKNMDIDYNKNNFHYTIPVFVLFQILNQLLGSELSRENFISKLNTLEKPLKQWNRNSNSQYEFFLTTEEVEDLQDVLFHMLVDLKTENSRNQTLYLRDLDISIKYNLDRSNYTFYTFITNIERGKISTQDEIRLRFNLNYLLKETFQKYISARR